MYMPKYIGCSVLLISALIMTGGCFRVRPPKTPIDSLSYGVEGQGAGTLIVFLPGWGDSAGDFEKQGFVSAVRSVNRSIDMVAVDAHLGYYESESIVERLLQDVIGPARESGYKDIWLVGTSLGGLGAAAFCSDHEEAIAGLVLLAPYLGPPEEIARISSAGGLAQWKPAEDGDVYERLWSWLKGYSDGRTRPELILAFGE